MGGKKNETRPPPRPGPTLACFSLVPANSTLYFAVATIVLLSLLLLLTLFLVNPAQSIPASGLSPSPNSTSLSRSTCTLCCRVCSLQ